MAELAAPAPLGHLPQSTSRVAWKLALTLRGRARPALLASFASERLIAGRHVLEVSDRIHGLARAAVESARTGVRRSPPTRAEFTALARSRCMLDARTPGVASWTSSSDPG
jgi:6-methylpretetramide 4-monooxygenase / 4-hydroxy-6-methylpretetramide 12a-monooxygenase